MISSITYDDLARLDCLSDLICRAHLRKAHSSQDEDDEPRAGPPFVLSAGFVLLSDAVEQTTDERNLTRRHLKITVED